MSKEAEIAFTRQAQIELKKYAEDNGLHIREIVDEKIEDHYPMFWAAKYGKVTVIDLLATMYRGNVNARHSTGKTALDSRSSSAIILLTVHTCHKLLRRRPHIFLNASSLLFFSFTSTYKGCLTRMFVYNPRQYALHAADLSR